MTQTKPVQIVCTNCGSSDVCCDATAQFNPFTQDWELCGTQDQGYCETCGEVNLETVDMADRIDHLNLSLDGDNTDDDQRGEILDEIHELEDALETWERKQRANNLARGDTEEIAANAI